MDVDAALGWMAQRRTAVLITIRADGRPQSSDVVYVVEDGTVVVSLTADRAKTANLRRDPRCVVHVTDPASWSYVSLDATAELTPVTTEPGDATSDALVDHYERVAGEAHPDWDEYRAAMVAERRQLARITPRGAVGQI